MNICSFSGEVVKAATYKKTRSGNMVAHIVIAVEFGFGPMAGSFPMRLSLHGKKAESKEVESVRVGDYVEAAGELRVMSWVDDDGNAKVTVELDVGSFSVVAGAYE